MRPTRQQPKSWFRLTLLRFLVVAVIAFATGLAVSAPALNEWLRSRDRRESMNKEIRTLQDEVAGLEAAKAELEGHGFAEEEAIRKELHRIKPGETLLLYKWDESELDGDDASGDKKPAADANEAAESSSPSASTVSKPAITKPVKPSAASSDTSARKPLTQPKTVR